MGESFQCRGSGKGEGWGLLEMWPGIELVGKESVCKVRDRAASFRVGGLKKNA